MNNIAIRASSMPGLFDCPARWEATYIRGLRIPSNDKAMLGKAVHASTAVYDLNHLRGNKITVDEAAGAAVDAIQKPDEEVLWEEAPNKVEKIALDLHHLYCADVAPTMDYAGVEITCETLEITDLGLVLTGTADRVYKDKEGHWGVADIKTGKCAVNTDGTAKTAGHAWQLGVYELLVSAATGIQMEAPAQVIGLQAGKTAKGQRSGTGQVHNPKAALIGEGDGPGILEMAANLIHSGNFFPNPRSMFCSSKSCPIHNTCIVRR